MLPILLKCRLDEIKMMALLFQDKNRFMYSGSTNISQLSFTIKRNESLIKDFYSNTEDSYTDKTDNRILKNYIFSDSDCLCMFGNQV